MLFYVFRFEGCDEAGVSEENMDTDGEDVSMDDGGDEEDDDVDECEEDDDDEEDEEEEDIEDIEEDEPRTVPAAKVKASDAPNAEQVKIKRNILAHLNRLCESQMMKCLDGIEQIWNECPRGDVRDIFVRESTSYMVPCPRCHRPIDTPLALSPFTETLMHRPGSIRLQSAHPPAEADEPDRLLHGTPRGTADEHGTGQLGERGDIEHRDDRLQVHRVCDTPRGNRATPITAIDRSSLAVDHRHESHRRPDAGDLLDRL